MRDIVIIILIIAAFLMLAIGITSCSNAVTGIYHTPGNCPKCNTNLVKGIYGMYAANIVWYCPNPDCR